MLKQLFGILLLAVIIHSDCLAQETDSGPGFQMIMRDNPSFSGIEGDGVLRLSYLNFYPGNNYNLNTVYFSFDSYFPQLHGGAGFYLSDDYLGGIINDIRGGLSYAYFLQAGRDFYINAGLSASVYHRGFSFTRAVFPDQIDPLGGVSGISSETLSASGRTVFDIGAGFLFISGKFFGGVSLNHLAEPDLSLSGFYNERLKRKFLFHLSMDIDLNDRLGLKARPMAFFEMQGEFVSAGSGAVLESKYLSINTILMCNNTGNLDMQTGFSFMIGKVSAYYNYRFNIVSGNKLLALSLLHQTGLAISLYNVDKRNPIKTINFPKL